MVDYVFSWFQFWVIYHGRPWLNMLYNHDYTWLTMSFSCLFATYLDHGQPWSNLCHLTFMVNHGQTMVLPLTDHGRPWLLTMINRGKNMVDHGLTVVLTQGQWVHLNQSHLRVEIRRHHMKSAWSHSNQPTHECM